MSTFAKVAAALAMAAFEAAGSGACFELPHLPPLRPPTPMRALPLPRGRWAKCSGKRRRLLQARKRQRQARRRQRRYAR